MRELMLSEGFRYLWFPQAIGAACLDAGINFGIACVPSSYLAALQVRREFVHRDPR
jgi:hypothetical protein